MKIKSLIRMPCGSVFLSPFSTQYSDIVRMVSQSNLTLCVDAQVFIGIPMKYQRAKFRFDHGKVTHVLDYIEEK